jgi:hypothetical protein
MEFQLRIHYNGQVQLSQLAVIGWLACPLVILSDILSPVQKSILILWLKLIPCPLAVHPYPLLQIVAFPIQNDPR